MPPIPVIDHAEALLRRYDVLLCDIWGVLHDGRRAFDGANEALVRFKAEGGTVVLVSNAPNPAEAVARVLDQKGVLRGAWDEIVSSGDIALRHIKARGFTRVHAIGPARRDHHFFEALPGRPAPLEEAEAVACTGLDDDRRETAADYRPRLELALKRRLPLVCANPDLAVHVGDHLLPCAGAIADLYERMGGEVVWAGKPRPIAYATALAAAERLRDAAVDLGRVLAIGDSIRTDLAAAQGAGVDALFIAGGIHRDEIVRDGEVDQKRLARLLADDAPPPVAIARTLAW